MQDWLQLYGLEHNWNAAAHPVHQSGVRCVLRGTVELIEICIACEKWFNSSESLVAGRSVAIKCRLLKNLERSRAGVLLVPSTNPAYVALYEVLWNVAVVTMW